MSAHVILDDDAYVDIDRISLIRVKAGNAPVDGVARDPRSPSEIRDRFRAILQSQA